VAHARSQHPKRGNALRGPPADGQSGDRQWSGSRPSGTWFGRPQPAAGTVSVHASRARAIPPRGVDQNRPERACARPGLAAPVQPGAKRGPKFRPPDVRLAWEMAAAWFATDGITVERS
jgi:hypothetical protein